MPAREIARDSRRSSVVVQRGNYLSSNGLIRSSSRRTSMFDLGKAVGNLAKWEKLRGSRAAVKTSSGGAFTTLEAHTYQSRKLHMRTYMPSEMADHRALVVVLHGCGQTAAGYDHGAGWSTLAERYGFALLLPEQQRSNNPNGCFNWFEPGIPAGAAARPHRSGDGPDDGARERHRTAPRIHHWSVGGRSHDVGDARLLSRVVRRGRDHRRPPYGAAETCSRRSRACFKVLHARRAIGAI